MTLILVFNPQLTRGALWGRGLGMILLKTVTKQVVRFRARWVEWCTLDWNVKAVNFYQALDVALLPKCRLCRLTALWPSHHRLPSLQNSQMLCNAVVVASSFAITAKLTNALQHHGHRVAIRHHCKACGRMSLSSVMVIRYHRKAHGCGSLCNVMVVTLSFVVRPVVIAFQPLMSIHRCPSTDVHPLMSIHRCSSPSTCRILQIVCIAYIRILYHILQIVCMYFSRSYIGFLKN